MSLLCYIFYFLTVFPLLSSMSVTRLEPELQAKIQEVSPELERVYFNKGL